MRRATSSLPADGPDRPCQGNQIAPVAVRKKKMAGRVFAVLRSNLSQGRQPTLDDVDFRQTRVTHSQVPCGCRHQPRRGFERRHVGREIIPETAGALIRQSAASSGNSSTRRGEFKSVRSPTARTPETPRSVRLWRKQRLRSALPAKLRAAEHFCSAGRLGANRQAPSKPPDKAGVFPASSASGGGYVLYPGMRQGRADAAEFLRRLPDEVRLRAKRRRCVAVSSGSARP